MCEQTGRSGRGEEARRQERGQRARGAPGHAGHADAKTRCSTPRPTIICWRSRAQAARPVRTGIGLGMDRHFDQSNSAVTECATGELAAHAGAHQSGRGDGLRRALHRSPISRRLLRELPAVTPLTRDVFDGATAERRLGDYFGVATMDGFGALSRLEATAAAACITYIERTQVGKRLPLSPPMREATGTTMAIDRRDARQSRTDEDARRRAARLSARRDRLHRDRGGLAPAGAAPCRAADGCRRNCARGSMPSRAFVAQRRAA